MSNTNERTIKNLLKHNGKIYIFLRGKDVAREFARMATEEGITYANGAPFGEDTCSDLYSLHDDLTVSYIGWIGHMGFYSVGSEVAPVTRVDFARYILGRDDYVIESRAQLDELFKQ